MEKIAIPSQTNLLENKKPGNGGWPKSGIELSKLKEIFDRLKKDFSELNNLGDEYEMNVWFNTFPAKSSDPCLLFYGNDFIQKNSRIIEVSDQLKSKISKPRKGFAVVRTLTFKEENIKKALMDMKRFKDYFIKLNDSEFESKVNADPKMQGIYHMLSQNWKLREIILSSDVSDSYEDILAKSNFLKDKSYNNFVEFEDATKNVDIKNTYKNIGIKVGVLDEDATIYNGELEDTIEFKSYITKEENFLTDDEYEEYWLMGNAPTVNHGKIVSSLISWGATNYSDETKFSINVKYCGIMRHDLDTESFGTIRERIVKAIEDNGDIRFWNLSLNMEENEIDPKGKLSSMAAWLDEIQSTYGIKIFNSAGNGSEQHHYILQPSESILATSVNAIDIEKESTEYAMRGYSNYKGIKPDYSDFGGSELNSPVKCFSPTKNSDQIISDVGTSFSTPIAFRKFILRYKKYGEPHKKMMIPGTLSEIYQLMDARKNYNDMASSWKERNKSQVGNGILSRKYENNNFWTWFIQPLKELRYRDEGYINLQIPYLSNMEYTIYLDTISNVLFDRKWGVEYVRMNVNSKLAISLEVEGGGWCFGKKSELVGSNRIKDINHDKLYDDQLNYANGKWRRIFSDSIDIYDDENAIKIKEHAKICDNAIKNVGLVFSKNHRIMKDGKYLESKDVLDTNVVTSITFVAKDPNDQQKLNASLQEIEENNDHWEYIDYHDIVIVDEDVDVDF